MKHEKSDKARACAILTLALLYSLSLSLALCIASVFYGFDWSVVSRSVCTARRPAVCPKATLAVAYDVAASMWREQVDGCEHTDEDDRSGDVALGLLSKTALGTPYI
jgi:hypothetical protein